MKVAVRLFATLTPFLPGHSRGGEAELDVPDDLSLLGLRALLGIPPDLSVVALVNGEDTLGDQRLAPGDVVSLFPPLVGGA